MLSADDRRLAADLLAGAARDRQPVSPLTERWGAMDVEDAYAIQLRGIDDRRAAGGRVRGHKVGLSSKAMQRQVGVHEPDYGHLLDDMFVLEEERLDPGAFLQPRVEVELAFVLGRRLEGPGVTVADVVRAVDCVLPALEIVDSRIADWRVRIEDTIADNASSGALVLGGRPCRLTDVDPRAIGAGLSINGELRQTGSMAGVLGNPVSSVAWLANKVAAFGVALEEGHVVLPGSCTRMEPIADGDVVRADFGSLGPVGFHVGEAP
jgi:2-keto-4-pentenoate hydratase